MLLQKTKDFEKYTDENIPQHSEWQVSFAFVKITPVTGNTL